MADAGRGQKRLNNDGDYLVLDLKLNNHSLIKKSGLPEALAPAAPLDPPMPMMFQSEG